MLERGEKVFVTGGTGFIGRRLLRLLSERGVPAVALCRRLDHGLAQDSRLEVRQADLLDPEGLARAMEGCRCGLHLAGMVSFDPRDAAALKQVNVEGTRCFLRAARWTGMRRVVVVSSAATIGLSPSPSALLDEDAPFDPRLLRRNVYLASKKEMEEIALAGSSPEMEVVVANPTTVFGPGDRSLNSGSLIKAVAAGRVVPVPPGGTSVVDVDDVGEALMLMLARGDPGRRYILTGENLTFRQTFETIAAATGRRPTFVYLPRLARLPMKLAGWAVHHALAVAGKPAWLITPQIVEDTFLYKFYDSRRAKADLGWRAGTPFAVSVERAWQYYLAEGLMA